MRVQNLHQHLLCSNIKPCEISDSNFHIMGPKNSLVCSRNFPQNLVFAMFNHNIHMFVAGMNIKGLRWVSKFAFGWLSMQHKIKIVSLCSSLYHRVKGTSPKKINGTVLKKMIFFFFQKCGYIFTRIFSSKNEQTLLHKILGIFHRDDNNQI